MVFDIDAYSQSKGIPRGVISSETIKKVEAMTDEGKKTSSSSAYNTFAEMCNSTQSALEACVSEKKSVGYQFDDFVRVRVCVLLLSAVYCVCFILSRNRNEDHLNPILLFLLLLFLLLRKFLPKNSFWIIQN